MAPSATTGTKASKPKRASAPSELGPSCFVAGILAARAARQAGARWSGRRRAKPDVNQCEGIYLLESQYSVCEGRFSLHGRSDEPTDKIRSARDGRWRSSGLLIRFPIPSTPDRRRALQARG